MSRVEIEAGGRRVVVDHDAELEHVARHAQQLWDHTAAAHDRYGPAFGLAPAAPRATPNDHATRGGGYRSRSGFAPITAETETP